MKHFTKIKQIASGLTLGVVLLASSATAAAAPASSAPMPPSGQANSGQQAKAPFEPGTRDAKATSKLGATTEAKGNLALSPLAGYVSGVDFSTFYNYCWKNLSYTTVYNSTSTTKYIRVQVYNQGSYRDIYTSVAPNGSYTYPAFYGIDGSYYAYLYVWNGSSYVYDEYKTSNNTCNVSVTRTYDSGGWVQLKIQNLGTAYATQISTELAPYPGSGTYTGTQYDYPSPGGAALYRWFYVGYSPYGISSYTYGSFKTPVYFTGDH